MKRDYSSKLQNLRARRLGFDAPSNLVEAASFSEAVRKAAELYESKGKTDAQRYALGAMQEVDSKIAYEEGDRVRKQLEDGLAEAGISVEFEYQGSVPLNVHIQKVSDIDLLVLHAYFLTVHPQGARARAGYYSAYTHPDPILVRMIKLRRECETLLDKRYPQAKVDKTGGKAIKLSGGSFRRQVDVVPSHWHDTIDYQATLQKHDREIYILNKDLPRLDSNRPFMHMKKINDKDAMTFGGAKKVIRLFKNLKRDAAPKIDRLSGYDLASLIWHFDNSQLMHRPDDELALIPKALDFLNHLVEHPDIALALDTPDGSRKIFNEAAKLTALKHLRDELAALADEIAQEKAQLAHLLGLGLASLSAR